MKRIGIQLLIIVSICFWGLGCSRVRQSDNIAYSNEKYIAERVFDQDFSEERVNATWITGTNYYFVIDDTIYCCNLISREVQECKIKLDNKEIMGEACQYSDTDGHHHLLCKQFNQETEKNEASICVFDSNGDLISENDCTEIMKKVYDTACFMGFLTSGQLLIFYSNEGTQWQMLVSETGQVIYDEPKEWMVKDCKTMEDGSAILYTQKGLYKMFPDDGTWESLDPRFKDDEFWWFMRGADDSDGVYYRTETEIRKYEYATKTISRIVEFEDIDLNPHEVGSYIIRLPNEHFSVFSGPIGVSFNFYEVRQALDDEQIPEKMELTLALVGMEGMYDKEVYAYNALQKTVRIRLKLYEDETSLLTDLTAGNVPDLIDLGDDVVYHAMEKQGLLENLYPYLTKDDEIAKEDFLEIALQFYGNGENLFAIPYSLELCSLMGNKEFIGNKDAWNLAEFESFIESLPDSQMATEGLTRNELFYYLCMQYYDHFVDGRNGTCNFQTEEFQNLLKCAKQFRAIDDDDYDQDRLDEMIVDRESILAPLRVTGVNFEYAYIRSLFQQSGKVIGFPSDRENGNLVFATPIALAITTKGTHKEEAWKFVKYIMTQERENFDYMDFVSYKPLYEQHMNKLKKEAKSGEPIGQITVGNMSLDMVPATLAEIEELQNALVQGTIIKPGDYRILDMIDEEAESYFSGDKTAAQVAEVIQKRAKLYLTE